MSCKGAVIPYFGESLHKDRIWVTPFGESIDGGSDSLKIRMEGKSKEHHPTFRGTPTSSGFWKEVRCAKQKNALS